MTNQELVNYIKQRLDSGYEQYSIRQKLLEKGWKPADIDDAFYFLEQDGTYAIKEEKPKRNKHKFPCRKLAIILVIILIAAFSFLFLSGTAQT